MQGVTGLKQKAVPKKLKNEFFSMLTFELETFNIVNAVPYATAFYPVPKQKWKRTVI